MIVTVETSFRRCLIEGLLQLLFAVGLATLVILFVRDWKGEFLSSESAVIAMLAVMSVAMSVLAAFFLAAAVQIRRARMGPLTSLPAGSSEGRAEENPMIAQSVFDPADARVTCFAKLPNLGRIRRQLEERQPFVAVLRTSDDRTEHWLRSDGTRVLFTKIKGLTEIQSKALRARWCALHDQKVEGQSSEDALVKLAKEIFLHTDATQQ